MEGVGVVVGAVLLFKPFGDRGHVDEHLHRRCLAERVEERHLEQLVEQVDLPRELVEPAVQPEDELEQPHLGAKGRGGGREGWVGEARGV